VKNPLDPVALLLDAYRAGAFPMAEGRDGPVTELLIVCRRKDIKWILDLIKADDPDAFYIIEQAREVSHLQMPAYQEQEPTGWRAVLKRK
jgi:hypothetical protein